MLFKLDRRYSLFALLLLVSLLFLGGTSCTVEESPGQVNPPIVNPSVTDNTTAPVLLDIKSFAALPKTIKLGENTVLSWKVSGASSISIDPAIGSVTGNSGNVSISPQGTTLYTLRASDGRYEVSARFLVIVETADGTIVWPKISSDNITTEPLYEGWSHYPNKYVVWNITDRYKAPYSESDYCGQIGYIINNHSGWMMTEVTINKRVVFDFILPSTQRNYVTSVDCVQLPELKWKWKVYK